MYQELTAILSLLEGFVCYPGHLVIAWAQTSPYMSQQICCQNHQHASACKMQDLPSMIMLAGGRPNRFGQGARQAVLLRGR